MKLSINSSFVVVGEDIKNGDIIKFADEGKEVESRFKDRDGNPRIDTQFMIAGSFGIGKLLTVNKTSKRNMINQYGNETRGWIGKEAKVNIIRQMIDKEFKNVVILTAPNKDLEGNVINE